MIYSPLARPFFLKILCRQNYAGTDMQILTFFLSKSTDNSQLHLKPLPLVTNVCQVQRHMVVTGSTGVFAWWAVIICLAQPSLCCQSRDGVTQWVNN